MNRFSFRKPFIDYLTSEIFDIFQGVDKIWTILKRSDTNIYELFEITNLKKNNIKVALINETPKQQNKLVADYKWISNNKIPYKIGFQRKDQIDIFDEYENRILLLNPSKTNDYDFLSIYIFFNENNAKSGVNKDGRLTTENKKLLGSILLNYINQNILKYNNDINTAKELSNIQHEFSHQDNNSNNNYFYAYVENIIEDKQKELDIEIQIKKETLEFLNSQMYSPNELKTVIEKSILWIMNISPIADSIFIEKDYLPKTNNLKKETEIKTTKKQHPEKLNRTFELLNKLENAAQIVLSSNRKLTSIAVGKAFESPISAPAISDALKKHSKKIQILLKYYPNKWLTIRANFKPLQNIIELNDDNNLKSAI